MRHKMIRFGDAMASAWPYANCASLQTDNHTNTSVNFYRPVALSDAQPTVSKQWRQKSCKCSYNMTQRCCSGTDEQRGLKRNWLTHSHLENGFFSGNVGDGGMGLGKHIDTGVALWLCRWWSCRKCSASSTMLNTAAASCSGSRALDTASSEPTSLR